MNRIICLIALAWTSAVNAQAPGTSEIPLDLYSVSRFAPDFNEDELVEACVDAYAHHYSEDYAALGQAG